MSNCHWIHLVETVSIEKAGRTFDDSRTQFLAARVYQALTVADRFDRVVQLSGVMSSMMKSMPLTVPVHIDARPGGHFALFGGYITGYNLEPVPNTRVVQAWRAGNWSPGVYSVAKLALSGNSTNATLTFDHTGFPDEAAEHLASGWHSHYREPMAKLFRGG
ncbi:MAG TPA: SRPBCC domain-containing protein [Rhizomicrobium sp.]